MFLWTAIYIFAPQKSRQRKSELGRVLLKAATKRAKMVPFFYDTDAPFTRCKKKKFTRSFIFEEKGESMTTNFCGAVKMAEFFIREYITCAANLFDRDFASSFKNGCHLAAVIDGWYRSRDRRRRWNFFFLSSRYLVTWKVKGKRRKMSIGIRLKDFWKVRLMSWTDKQMSFLEGETEGRKGEILSSI